MLSSKISTVMEEKIEHNKKHVWKGRNGRNEFEW